MTGTNGTRLSTTAIADRLNAGFITNIHTLSAANLKKVKPQWGQLTPYVASSEAEGSAAYHFFTPEELFNIEQAGTYTLKMEFQVFKPGRPPTMWPVTIVSLPPVEIPVIVREVRKAPTTR
jgi:hypothetical protein